jgi:hypothetical protein
MLGFFFLFFETGAYYVVHASLELVILMSQSPEFWDYRCVCVCYHTWLEMVVLKKKKKNIVSLVATVFREAAWMPDSVLY